MVDSTFTTVVLGLVVSTQVLLGLEGMDSGKSILAVDDTGSGFWFIEMVMITYSLNI